MIVFEDFCEYLANHHMIKVVNDIYKCDIEDKTQALLFLMKISKERRDAMMTISVMNLFYIY